MFLLWVFSPFVLIKEGSGMCPVCTVYYRHILLGHWSCWDFHLQSLAPLSFLQIWLDKGRRYKRRAGIVLERSEPRWRSSM